MQDVEKPKEETSALKASSSNGIGGSAISSTAAATVKDAGYSNDAGYRCTRRCFVYFSEPWLLVAVGGCLGCQEWVTRQLGYTSIRQVGWCMLRMI